MEEKNVGVFERFTPKTTQWIGIYWSFLWRLCLISLAVGFIIFCIAGVISIIIGILLAVDPQNKEIFPYLISLIMLVAVIITFFIMYPIAVKWFLKTKHNGFRIIMINNDGTEFKGKLSFGEKVALAWACMWRSILMNLLIGIIAFIVNLVFRLGFNVALNNMCAGSITASIINFGVLYMLSCLLLVWILKCSFGRYEFAIIKDVKASAGKGWLIGFVVFAVISILAPILVNSFISRTVNTYHSNAYGNYSNINHY